MSLLQFASIKLTIALVIGIVLGSYVEVSILHATISTLLFLLFLGFCFFSKNNYNALFITLTMATTSSVGVLVTALHHPKNYNSYFDTIESSKPQLYTLKITEIRKANTYYSNYIAKVISANDVTTSGKILLSIAKDSALKSLNVDDEIQTFHAPKALKAPLNPYQFNYKKHMESLGVFKQIKVFNKKYQTLQNPSVTIFGLASKIRKRIITKLKKYPFGAEELSIIQALLLGERQDISTATYENYKKAGAIHILALSGLHIGILLFLLNFLLEPISYIPNGKKIKLLVLVSLLWCFALLAGFSAPIIRATTMFSFVAYALYLNRPSNTFNILALSIGFILLLINPKLIFQVGFQMSYAAVFAIVWIYPKMQRFWFPKNKILNKLWQLLSVSVAAQLGVLPISLFYFHQFPSLFFISNLIIIPFLGFILGFGLLIIFLASIHCLPNHLALLYHYVIQYMNTIIRWIAEQEAFVFSSISFNQTQLFLGYFLVLSLVNVLSKATYKRVIVFLVSILFLQIHFVYQDHNIRKEEKVWVLQEPKKSVLLHQNGKKLAVLSSDNKKVPFSVDNYATEKNMDYVVYDSLQNSYSFGVQNLRIIDSTGIYISTKTPASYLLSNSPKINLNRFIDSVQPTTIIADGSNYKSYVTRWQETCRKRKIPFHNTGEKGAYAFGVK